LKITSAVTFFNGDDALSLQKKVNGTDFENIDVFGVIGVQQNWPVGSGSTKDHALVRKANVTSPTTTWDTDEWVVYPTDTFTHLGTHTFTSAP